MENSNKIIALMLKDQRYQNNLSIKDVVYLLSKYYEINISEKTLYSWENGRSLPSTDIFVALCDLYEVEDLAEAMNHASSFSETEHHIRYKRKELQVIASYRKHPELQSGIRKILELDTDSEEDCEDKTDNTPDEQ